MERWIFEAFHYWIQSGAVETCQSGETYLTENGDPIYLPSMKKKQLQNRAGKEGKKGEWKNQDRKKGAYGE